MQLIWLLTFGVFSLFDIFPSLSTSQLTCFSINLKYSELVLTKTILSDITCRFL